METPHFPRRRLLAALAGAGVILPHLGRAGSARQAGSRVPNRPLIVTSKTQAQVREKVTTAGMDALRRGEYALDAAEKAVNVSEADPLDTSVGYGGDPNEEGFLQLDASIMSGRDGCAAGAVAALENIKTPVSVARLVMERTDHWMLVGKGALKSARMHGFKDQDLLTDQARDHCREWKENLNPRDYYFGPKDRPGGAAAPRTSQALEALRRRLEDLDTITVLVPDGNGDNAGATSTVGHHFKIVGRVGDSPIIGAGLYGGNAVGAAGATGHGDEIVRHCASFHVVEKMRDGLSPEQACEFVCRRAIERHGGKRMFNFKLVALNKKGEYGCCSIRGRLDGTQANVIGQGFFVHDSRGARLEQGNGIDAAAYRRGALEAPVALRPTSPAEGNSMTREIIATAAVCLAAPIAMGQGVRAATFADDIAFLKKYVDLIVLSDQEGSAKVALSAAWQGRVITSTASGDAGGSFGWINRELIASGKFQPHINVFGGEDRFWMGPEGGQFSIFFAKGAKFELADWFTPAPIDTLPFTVTSQSPSAARFASKFTLTNYSGTRFDVAVDREVRLLGAAAAWEKLGVKPAVDVAIVAFESDNRITNAGTRAWKKDTGLVSIWILGMFNPSPSTTIVVPIRPGSESTLGTKVTSDYFGEIPPDRLAVKGDVIYFSADGKYRSKIGISPRRSKGVLGSYDVRNHVLTIVQFSQPAAATEYVNSLWRLQGDPYAGDAANAYNDGPPVPGAKPLGPFYELESSSPATALAPGESLSHVHRTIHLSGEESALDAVARATLGVSIAEIEAAVKPR